MSSPGLGLNTTLLSCVYIAAISAANLLVTEFGPWFSVVNSFILIGLDLTLRDNLHERVGVCNVIALSLIAGAVSFAINPASAHVSLASSLSFVLANVADTAVYHTLRTKAWFVKANASNVFGALVDSIAFPLLAFGVVMPTVSAAQFAAKVLGAALWSLPLARSRA